MADLNSRTPIKRPVSEDNVPMAKKTKTEVSSSSTQPLNPPVAAVPVAPLHPSIVTNRPTQEAGNKENTTTLKHENNSMKAKENEAPSTTNASAAIEDKIIVFDLETTDLIRGTIMPDICQIAAQVIGEEEVWSKYLIPVQAIKPGASKINGLVVKRAKGARVMTKNKVAVEAFEYQAGLGMFYEYLCEKSRQVKKSGSSGRIILVAHHGKGFDLLVLIHAFKKIGVQQANLDKMNIVFADSLLILKEAAKNPENQQLFAYYKKEGSKKENNPFSMANLHRHFCHDRIPGAHDACQDVKGLIRVLQSSLVSPEATIASNTFNRI